MIGTYQIASHAAACTFYLFLSFVPITALLCTILSCLLLTKEQLIEFAMYFVPDYLIGLCLNIIRDVFHANIGVISVSGMVAVWSASRAFVILSRGMDQIYNCTASHPNGRLFMRLRAAFYTIAFIAVVILSIVILVFGRKMLDLLVQMIPEAEPLAKYIDVLRIPTMFAVLVVIFSLFYKFVPFGRRKFALQFPGAVCSALGWILFSAGFSVYLSHTGFLGTYGSIGTVVIALFWGYYCIRILLFGALINHVLPQRKNTGVRRKLS